MITEPNRKKKDSRQGLSQWKAIDSLLTRALPPSFSLYKRVLLPLPCWDLHVACQSCRSQIAILCWSQINSSLLERYPAVCSRSTVQQIILSNCKVSVIVSPLQIQAWMRCSVQLLSYVWLFATPWTAAHQVFLSITNSRSPPKPMSIELVMPSNHLILCRPLLLLPSIFPSIRGFSNESALHIRWPKY